MVESHTNFRNEVMFGFWPEAKTISWSAGRIEPLQNHQEIVDRVLSSPKVQSGWYEPGGGAFFLDSTHVARLNRSVFDDQGANFIIALVGMLHGLRLQREKWQHLKRTPVETRKLCDFLASKPEVEKTIQIATIFWQQAKPEVRNIAFGALHWHLFAQTYQHDFEKFNAQYTALDACYALAQKSLDGFLKVDKHTDRTRMMCWQLGVPVPAWASPDKSKVVAVARCRNALVHEAIFADQPIGFAVSSDCHDMMEQLNGLVARLFLRLIGVENEYTRSECTTAQTIGFTFPMSQANP